MEIKKTQIKYTLITLAIIIIIGLLISILITEEVKEIESNETLENNTFVLDNQTYPIGTIQTDIPNNNTNSSNPFINQSFFNNETNINNQTN